VGVDPEGPQGGGEAPETPDVATKDWVPVPVSDSAEYLDRPVIDYDDMPDDAADVKPVADGEEFGEFAPPEGKQ
jgi:hypothetical protein